MFATKNYQIIQSFLSPEMCQLVFDYISLRRETKTMLEPDDRVPGAGRLNGDMLLETILKQKQSTIETLIGAPVWPSYTYARMHSCGASMVRHIDRPASEIGVTVAIGGDRKWPIWFSTADGDVPVELESGEAVMYRGCILPHWRERYAGRIQVQCMFFYVEKNGPNAVWKFNGRKGVGFPQPVSVGMSVYQTLKRLNPFHASQK